MNQTYEASFFDGTSSHDCTVAVEQLQLHIYFKDKNIPMQIWAMEKITTAMGEGRLVIRQPLHPNTYLTCSGSAGSMIQQAMRNPPPPPPKKRFTGSHAVVIAIPLIAIGAIVGLYFLLVPWLSRVAADAVPLDTEISLGQNMSEEYVKQSLQGDSATYYANAFFTAMSSGSKYPVKIHIIKSEELNAFAVPGGNIFVYTGLLSKMKTPEELAGLLGHEVTHVNKRHSLKALCRQATGAIVIGAILGDVSDMGSWLLSKADDLRQLDYSRDLETESDDGGLEIMKKSKIDPNGMVRLLDLLNTQNAKMPGMMKYLSTHPETDARIENVKKQITKEMNWACPQALQMSFEKILLHLK